MTSRSGGIEIVDSFDEARAWLGWITAPALSAKGFVRDLVGSFSSDSGAWRSSG